jgi:flagellin
MSVRVNTNVDAFDAQRNLGLVSMNFSKSVAQLSSGLRINTSADDAAGLAISQKLTTQVNGFDQGARNAQDSISMLQTADGALNTTQQMLQRMRTLSVQASNDTYTSQDRANIQLEINQLIQEIDRIGSQTDFNTKKLLDGSAGGTQIAGGSANLKSIVAQAGVAAATTYTATVVSSATASAVEGSTVSGSFFTTSSSITITGALGTQTFTAYSGESLQTFFQQVDNAGIGVTMQADGTSQGRIVIFNNYYGISNANNTTGATQVTTSNITGDFGSTGLSMGFNVAVNQQGSISAISGGFQSTVATNAALKVNGTTVFGQGINSDQISGAGSLAGVVMQLNNVNNLSAAGTAIFTVVQNAALQFQIGANFNQTTSLVVDASKSQNLGVTSLSVATQTDAEAAINTLSNAINQVSQTRAVLGAVMNRLTNSMNNDNIAQENMLASRSQITDTNVAQTTVQFTRDQILLQAGTSVLAQANQSPTSLLGLLR